MALLLFLRAPPAAFPSMLLACFIAVASVLLGALLGFSRWASTKQLGPIKTFAFAAALAVVVTSFMPEALASLGVAALVPFAVGFFAPRLLELGVTFGGSHLKKADPNRVHMGLEVGYAGLAIHQLGDGVGMGALTGPAHTGHHHLDVFLAIGGHTVPVAAVVVVAFAQAKGRFVAAQRAIGLAASVVLGLLVARYFGVSIGSRWGGITGAVVGGLLLHIATHDLAAALPTSTVSRAVDFAAGLCGLLVVAAAGREPGEEGGDPTRFYAALRELTLASAPSLLFALAVAIPIAIFAVLAKRQRAEAVAAALLAVPLLGVRAALALGAAAVVLASARRRSECGGDHTPPEQVVLGALSQWAAAAVVASLVVAYCSVEPSRTLDALAGVAVLGGAALGAPFAVVLAAGMIHAGANDTAVLGGLVVGLAGSTVLRLRDTRALLYGTAALCLFAFVLALPIANARFSGGSALGTAALAVLGLIAIVWTFSKGARAVAGTLVSESDGHGHTHDLDVGAKDADRSTFTSKGARDIPSLSGGP